MRYIVRLVFVMLLVMSFSADIYARTSSNKRDARNRHLRASTVTSDAEKAMLRGKYDDAFEPCEEYLRGGKRFDDRVCYLAATALLKLKRYSDAREYFGMILEKAKSDALHNEAYVGIGDSHYLSGDYKAAINTYDRALRYFPGSDNESTVYYAIGRCYKALGDNKKSEEYYGKLTASYPSSMEAVLFEGVPAGSIQYSVQVGVFKSAFNARNLKSELKAKGYDARIAEIPMDGINYYRVRVGPYDGRDVVENAALKLRNLGFPTQICQ